MIGNKYLQEFYEYPDEDSAINQLLEFLKSKDKSFLKSLNKPIDISECDEKELVFLTKISALIDYCLQLEGMEVPHWLRDKRLVFERPYFHPKRIDDIGKVKLQYTNPAPFRTRNVYFDLDGLKRI